MTDVVGATRPVSTPSEETLGLARDCHLTGVRKGSPNLSGVIYGVSPIALLLKSAALPIELKALAGGV